MKKILLGLTALLLLTAPAHATEKIAETKDKFLDIQEVTSPAGIKAWLVEDHSLPIIALKFSFNEAGAARDPADKQGLAMLVSNTLDEGAGNLDSQSFQKILSDKSITLSFSASRDKFYGTLKTLSRHKEDAFNLMHLALSEPRFDQEAIDRMKASNIARIRSSMTDPEWMAARLSNDISYAGHPYAQNSGGTLTTIAGLTREDLQSFVKSQFALNRLNIAVSGDITAVELAALLDRVFSFLPADSTSKPLDDHLIKADGQTYLFEKDIPQSIIQMFQPGIKQKDPDYYAASIMNFILGGSGFGSRLTEEVREKRGLTYGVYSSFGVYDHTNIFSVSLSTENKNTDEALKVIRQEMKRIQDQPITQKELDEAKSYIIGSLPLSFSSTMAIAANVLSLKEDNWPIDYYDQYPELIRQVSIEDVQRVARKVLQPESMVTVVVGHPPALDKVHKLTSLPNVE